MNIDNIISQQLPKQCIYSMIKRPDEAPRMIILSGSYGTGRKTLARNFVKSIYCPNQEKSGSNCGVCETCREILKDSRIYREYDYSQINKIEEAKYILITNFEKCPREDQKYLYDWYGEHDEVTIIITTENTDNIIDNIMTFSFILRTSLLTQNEIVNYLYDKSERLNLDISKDSLEVIARRSRGHLSEAIKMMSNYTTLDEETFKRAIMSAREYYICFLISCYRDRREDVDKYLSELKTIPLAYLKVDYEALILEIMKVATKIEKPKDKLMELLIKEIKTKALDLYYILNDKIIYNSFQSDDTFQAAMYVIYLKLNNRIR